MKFSCTKENLHRGLFFVAHIAGKTSALPILGNVLLEAKENALSLTTTNLEIGIRAIVRGKIEEDGSAAVDAKLLTDFVALLPNERVDAELVKLKDPATGVVLSVRAGSTQTTIHSASAEEFPIIPTVESALTVRVLCKELRSALSQTIFASAHDEGRPELQGVYVSITGTTMTLAATDSYRLAERKLVLATPPTNAAQSFATIIPAKTVSEFLRLSTALEESTEVELSFSATQAKFSGEGFELISRLVDRKYPDYAQVIPSRGAVVVRLPKSELTTAVRQAQLFCRTGVNDVKLSFTGDGVTVEASGARGEHSSLVKGEVEGVGFSIILNARYLLDGLSALSGQNVRVELVSSSQPCIFKSADGSDAASYLYLVMPIKQ